MSIAGHLTTETHRHYVPVGADEKCVAGAKVLRLIRGEAGEPAQTRDRVEGTGDVKSVQRDLAPEALDLKGEGKSGKRDSNSRLQPWEGCTLPTELFPLAPTR